MFDCQKDMLQRGARAHHANVTVNSLNALVGLWHEKFRVYELLYSEYNAILDAQANCCSADCMLSVAPYDRTRHG